MGFLFSDPFAAPLLGPEIPLRQTIKRLADDSADQVKLIRTMMGIANFSHSSYPGEIITQRANYSKLGAPINGSIDLAGLTSLLDDVGVPLTRLEERLMGTQVVSPFSKQILLEICWYFRQTEKDSHTTGFLHLYRAVERVSYSFPMAYAAVTTDYLKTYEELKSFFISPEQGELRFFRRFTEKVLDRPLLDAPCDLDFGGCDYSEEYCKIVQNCCDSTNTTLLIPLQSVSIQHRFLLDLVVNVRNRYFHFLSGKPDKYSSDDLPDSDLFFRVVNPRLMNWLGAIYFRILSIEVTR